MNNLNKKPLMPELRFPEFQSDGDWNALRLDQLSDRLTGKVGEEKLTTVSISAGKGFVSQAEKFSRDISGNQYKNYIAINKGDFSYNKGNSKKFKQGCIYKLTEFDRAAAPSAFLSFRFKGDYLSDFYRGYFDNNFHGWHLAKYITSGARSDGLLNISPDDFFSVILPTPENKNEQQKIADCLSGMDALIKAETEKLQNLKIHKQGLQQILFPGEDETVPKFRFPECQNYNNWKPADFDEICHFVRGPFGGALKKDIFVKTGYAVYEQSHAIHKDLFRFRYFIGEDKFNELKRFSVQESDLIMSCSGTMGKIAKIPKGFTEGVINQALLKLTVKKGYNQNFIQNLLELPLSQRKLLSQAAGGAIKNVVGVGEMKRIKFKIPSEIEQQKISDCLSSINAMILAQTQKVKVLKKHKEGLMQRLFPLAEEIDV